MDKVDLAFSLFLYEMLNKNCSNHSAVTMLTTLATEEKAKPGNDYTQSFQFSIKSGWKSVIQCITGKFNQTKYD